MDWACGPVNIICGVQIFFLCLVRLFGVLNTPKHFLVFFPESGGWGLPCADFTIFKDDNPNPVLTFTSSKAKTCGDIVKLFTH